MHYINCCEKCSWGKNLVNHVQNFFIENVGDKKTSKPKCTRNCAIF